MTIFPKREETAVIRNMIFLSDDDMILKVNPHDSRSLIQPAGQFDIRCARGRVARWVIMRENKRMGIVDYQGSEDFRNAGGTFIKAAQGNQEKAGAF